MYVAGYSINVLTLLLSFFPLTGMRRCHSGAGKYLTKVEEGLSPVQAAKEGSKEIFFAVISTTITLAAVFFPIMFLTGLTGRLFREFE
jgi:multidrug efflux pump